MKANCIATIDVFRAVTMFLMLFVNDIPGLKQIPHWMLHAQMDEDMLSCSGTIFHASCLSWECPFGLLVYRCVRLMPFVVVFVGWFGLPVL